MSQAIDQVLRYHQATKHYPNAYARGPGRLDWANQPDPFRRYLGSPLVMLDRVGLDTTGMDTARMTPSPLNKKSISQFFFCSLALSAWKSFGGSTWSLRVNPSSGNLHPTECYLICDKIEGIGGSPGIFHYAPGEHALEHRSDLEEDKWAFLGLPKGAILIALSSIHWRESWNYGERAFRYSMTDVGHALAALGMATSCLGWQTALLDGVGTDDLFRLLGIVNPSHGEAENPDCLLAVFTDGEMHDTAISHDDLHRLAPAAFQGEPNVLCASHVDWSIIDHVVDAVAKPPTKNLYGTYRIYGESPSKGQPIDWNFCRVARKRRSAQAMDRKTAMPFDRFIDILMATLPWNVPLSVAPWSPHIHLILFVHRVAGLERGLYVLLRDGRQRKPLQEAMSPDFLWERPDGATQDVELGLYLLAEGDARIAASQSSCRQEIASDGCFAAAMLAEFERPIQEFGAWFYPRLYWECGMIGQALYLGAEVAGFRGCGMGCYFDDVVYEMLGLRGIKYQDLYHFAVGKALDDPRLTTLPAYG